MEPLFTTISTQCRQRVNFIFLLLHFTLLFYFHSFFLQFHSGFLYLLSLSLIFCDFRNHRRHKTRARGKTDASSRSGQVSIGDKVIITIKALIIIILLFDNNIMNRSMSSLSSPLLRCLYLNYPQGPLVD